MFRPWSLSHIVLAALFACTLIVSLASTVQAGCGCNKPAPAPAAVRPHVTYSGTPVTLTDANLQAGTAYDVTFTAMTGQSVTVAQQAKLQRDIADSQLKTQLVVTVPPLPLGPVSISVSRSGQNGVLFVVPDSSFTVAPQPITIPAQFGRYHFKHFQGAVSRHGVFYLSLDLTNVTDPEIFQAKLNGYPLRFTTDNVVFYNIQGYLMQMLNQGIPGLASVASVDKARDSDLLQYSRHEFNSFFLAHQEREEHALDPNDANWHVDGTPHVDHNHLILAIAGQLGSNGTPTPGATKSFELRLTASSLFSSAVIGHDAVDIGGAAVINGDVQSNGVISLHDTARVNGDATGASVTMDSVGKQVSSQGHGSLPGDLLPVYMPQLMTDLGEVALTGAQTLTLGPGTYKVANLTLQGNSRLIINNATEAVTIYVMGNVDVAKGAGITAVATGPEDFSLYVQGSGSVSLVGSGTNFYGLVYAPQSVVKIAGRGNFYGAFVGQRVRVGGNVTLSYDTSSTTVKAKKAKAPKLPKR